MVLNNHNRTFGKLMTAADYKSLDVKSVKEMLIYHSFIIVDNYRVNADEFREMYAKFGEIVEYSEDKIGVGFGYVDTLPLHGEKNKVVTGRGQLPLHADGGLLRSTVDHVFLYSTEIQNMKYRGSTLIVDHVNANRNLPIHLKEILENETFQVQVLEKGYYSNVSPEGWFDVPVFTKAGSVNRMLLYFPFDEGQPSSWIPRIVGFSEQETKKFFLDLEKFYKKEHYCYKHYWKPHQLMIMDNRRVLHEREEFNCDSIIRKLYRGQTQDGQ